MIDKKALLVGEKTPSFVLKDEKGNRIALADFKNKSHILLFFYPGDMTPGCTLQLCEVRDDYRRIVSAGIKIFGVNHANADSHATFIEKYKFPFPLLIDPGKRVSMKYLAIKQFFNATVIKRTVVGIHKDGRIFFFKRGMPGTGEILKALKTYEERMKADG